LAFHFGTREYNNLKELLKPLEPFEIKTACSDNNFAYRYRITESGVVTGKKNTQKIERSQLRLFQNMRLRTKVFPFSTQGDTFFVHDQLG
jgi:IS1 family transposase